MSHLEKEMYSVDNVILSPHFLGLLLLHENIIKISDIFPDEQKGYMKVFLNNPSIEKLNTLSKYIEEKVIGSDKGNLKNITLVNGATVQIGSKYLNYNGHKLEDKIKEKFPQLKRFNTKNLLIETVDKVIQNFPQFLPKAL